LTKYSEPSTNNPIGFKKRKKLVKKGGLSFGDDNEDGDTLQPASTASTPAAEDSDIASEGSFKKKRSLKPNTSISVQPKAMTKSALLRDAAMKESLRKEYIQIQEAVKATEFCLPFVFFDGRDAPGGICRMKKGDYVWLFLERARKVGAAGGGGERGSRKDWARIGVDDLMIVRGDLIVPHVSSCH
jgi:protein FAM50